MNVWITGAGKGIGRAVALRFAKEEDRVFVSGRSLPALQKLARVAPDSMIPVVCDVLEPASVNQAREFIEARGGVDVLVNNAGVTVFKSFIDTTLEDFDAIMNTNLRGAFLCTKSVIESMVERRSGVIVMINSMAAREVFKNSSAYAATKAGLKALADGIRIEVRDKGIRVISIHPGATLTDMWPDRVRERRKEVMMQSEQVADVIFDAVNAPSNLMIEELYLQPIGGPL